MKKKPRRLSYGREAATRSSPAGGCSRRYRGCVRSLLRKDLFDTRTKLDGMMMFDDTCTAACSSCHSLFFISFLLVVVVNPPADE